MLVTVFLSLMLAFLTLLSTTFHLFNIGLFFLLLIWVFRTKDFAWLLLWESLLISLFGHMSWGLSLALLTVLVGLYLLGRENILPGRKSGSLLLAVSMLVVWEVVNNLIY